MVKKKESKIKKHSASVVSSETDSFLPVGPEEQKALEGIFALLLKSSRVDFSHYRHTTILRRMSRRMTMCKYFSYVGYLGYLMTNTAEVEQLHDDLLLFYTKFFRDPHIFDVLKKNIYPQIIKDRSVKTPIRIWVPGCSTGEEVYSLAICLYEYLEESKSKATIQFFGTDIVERHIFKARVGLYPDRITQEVSQERLEKFFDKTSEGLKVTKHIREMCVFAVQNITQDPPFSHIDLVSCRNVLIYFDVAFQETAIPLFHFSLKPSGFLLLGTSETMGRFPQFFDVVDQKANLYKKRFSSIKPDYNFPIYQTFLNLTKLTDTTKGMPGKSIGKMNLAKTNQQINDVLIENYAPPGVLIDNNMHIRQFIGHIFPYLGPVSGEASLKLSKMVGEGLMPDLYVALEEVKKKKTKVRKKNVRFKQNSKAITADITVIPIPDTVTSEINYLILFEESEQPHVLETSINEHREHADSELSRLKQELQLTKEHLQSIIEEKDEVNQELWAANEEVQSTNEELQSVNEEMEAAKEELESSNEELLALNEELQAKNIELTTTKVFAENLLETANTIVLTLDSSATIKAFNKYAEELTGYKKDDVIGRNWFDLFIPLRDKESIPKVFIKVLKNMPEIAQYENHIVLKSGMERLISWNNNVLRDMSGNVEGVLSIGMDITERKVAEDALKKSERNYRLLVENANTAIIRWNRDGCITYFNEFAVNFFGYSRNEILGKHVIGTIVPVTESTGRDLRPLMVDICTNPKKYEYNINENICKNGQRFWVAWANKVYENESTGDVEVLSIGTDITERRQAEKEKIKAQKYASEQEKHALVGQIAGNMAHDFNNILGVIMGNAELSLMDCNDPGIKKTFELIFEQTIRGKNLTKNLVAFAKSQEIKQEFFRITEKIDLVIDLLKKDLEGIELIKEYKQGLPELLADSGMIDHALINLVQNSIHALSRVKNPKITFRTYYLDDNIYFEIEDNGCGIPQKHLENIYMPSFTLKGNKDIDDSYIKNIRGTGYGMSNVKKYIEQHKGNISVESKFGAGTKFTISMPIIKKELTETEKAEICKSKLQFEKHILLVEDEQAISDIQYRILTQKPFNNKVDTANNGKVAIDLFERNTYDFVSLDYVLPGIISGMDVYNHIRKTNKTIPMLFISGNIEFLESIKELKQKDANIDHLSKPCRNIEYMDSINELLERALPIK
ncbi:MAG: PAS domain S-box protein [Desulfobacterales bacterium]|nr:PAS domain S-box protein [Desulfobacterales bacterium]